MDAVVEFVIWEQGFVFGEAGGLPKTVFRYGNTKEEIFVCYEESKTKYGKEVDKMSLGAVGVYSATEKIRVGLAQLMAGARKWKVKPDRARKPRGTNRGMRESHRYSVHHGRITKRSDGHYERKLEFVMPILHHT